MEKFYKLLHQSQLMKIKKLMPLIKKLKILKPSQKLTNQVKKEDIDASAFDFTVTDDK